MREEEEEERRRVTVTEGVEKLLRSDRTGLDLARAEIGRRLPRNWSALRARGLSSRLSFLFVLSDIHSTVLPADPRQLDALWKRFSSFFLPAVNGQIHPLSNWLIAGDKFFRVLHQ